MRKEKWVTITQEGRDKGKVFYIKEMPASQAERWATRAFLALAKSGVELPEYVVGAGMAGLAVVGLKALAGVKYNDPTDPEIGAEALLGEMMGCVKIVRDPKRPEMTFELLEDDIEEVKTLLFLRSEVFELHTGFSIAGAISESTTSTPAQTSKDSQTTRTSSPH